MFVVSSFWISFKYTKWTEFFVYLPTAKHGLFNGVLFRPTALTNPCTFFTSNIFSKFGKSARPSIVIWKRTSFTPYVNPTVKPYYFPSEFSSFMTSHISSGVPTVVHSLSPSPILYFNPSKGLYLSPSGYHSGIPSKLHSSKPSICTRMVP